LNYTRSFFPFAQ